MWLRRLTRGAPFIDFLEIHKAATATVRQVSLTLIKFFEFLFFFYKKLYQFLDDSFIVPNLPSAI
jgi:hypothetical protein